VLSDFAAGLARADATLFAIALLGLSSAELPPAVASQLPFERTLPLTIALQPSLPLQCGDKAC
jgi:hypothetical protein